MISPLRATPNATPAELANIINELWNQLESENRAKIIKDESGVDRVLIGRDPNGKYVVAISIEGKDVIEEIENGG